MYSNSSDFCANGQLDFFDTDNDTTADGKTHRVYTVVEKEKAKTRIAEAIDFVREEADALRLILSLFMKEVRSGRKISGNRLVYAARSVDVARHDGATFRISNNTSPILLRMIALQWPQYATLCSTSECVLDDDDVRLSIVPLGDIIDLGDLLGA